MKCEKQFNDEKEKLKQLILFEKEVLKQMETDLRNLNGIENKLYFEIVINGLKPSKAIEKVSMEEEKDVSTLWKNYYPKVKEQIKKLYMNDNLKIIEKEELYERN